MVVAVLSDVASAVLVVACEQLERKSQDRETCGGAGCAGKRAAAGRQRRRVLCVGEEWARPTATVKRGHARARHMQALAEIRDIKNEGVHR